MERPRRLLCTVPQRWEASAACTTEPSLLYYAVSYKRVLAIASHGQFYTSVASRVTTLPVFGGIVLEFNSLSRIPGKGRLDTLLSRPKLTLNFNRTSLWSLFSCYTDFKNILLSKFQIYVSYYVGLCFHVRY